MKKCHRTDGFFKVSTKEKTTKSLNVGAFDTQILL